MDLARTSAIVRDEFWSSYMVNRDTRIRSRDYSMKSYIVDMQGKTAGVSTRLINCRFMMDDLPRLH